METLEITSAPSRTETGTKVKVIRRNGATVNFDATKITVALTKAFLGCEGGQAAASSRVHEVTIELTNKIVKELHAIAKKHGPLHLEDIQDQVEAALMGSGHHKVARAYILYREKQRIKREKRKTKLKNTANIDVVLENGNTEKLDLEFLNTVVTEACKELTNVSSKAIIDDTIKNLFNGVSIADVRKTLILSARSLIETEPNYSRVAARLLLNNIRIEVCKFLHMPIPATQQEMARYYSMSLHAAIKHGVKCGRLNKQLMTDFNLDLLGEALVDMRDFKFNYLGLQTLYDRYFLHENEIRFEMPQVFFMRVAMGLALHEDDKTKRAIEFYNVLSSFDFMSSTPTLFNSGTIRSQLSSCYLSTVPDDLSGIYDAIKDNALLSKFAGGLGNDWTPVRAMNAYIHGTNGKSQGVVPFLKVANDSAVAVNQGGKRKGALCSYLESWHRDILEFLELRKNTGDERRRTHDMNTANWIPDLLVQRVIDDKDWTLFSPDETPDLHDLYGEAFAARYVEYEAMADKGKIKNFKRITAKSLWRKMLSMIFETGHPWFTFKDPCNIRSPQQHVGVVHSSNLCTEITLNTSQDEIAVCNLGSINLANHINETGLDEKKLHQTITTAVRMLDNVVDINFYAVPQARNSNLKHRPVGLGIMGFQDCLYQLNINYNSNDAVEFADKSMELISYYAIDASCDLASERGSYNSFEGSLWHQGVLPIDSFHNLAKIRGKYWEHGEITQTLDWDTLRTKVKQGMRNSNVMAIAPTATISNICGVSASIEPTYQNLFVKSNLSGEFTVVNQYLVDDLKALNMWDAVMVNDLKYFNGSIQKIDRIPEQLRQKYATSFEIEPSWLVLAGARRQKWIDQAQSLNLYVAKPSGPALDKLYRQAWAVGLKTTYYLRTLGATDAEKSTIRTNNLNAVATSNMCPIDDPSCEACQ